MKYIITHAFLLACILAVGQTNIFPSSGNVGVGTVSPDYKLHIQDGAGGAQLKFQRGTGLATIVQDNNTNDLYIDASSGIFLNSQAGGNVGIGTTSPDYRLHIKDGVGGAQLKFQRGTGLATIIQDNNVNDLYIDASSGIFLNSQAGGNVGIGTTSPLAKLHVADGNGGEQIRLSRGTGAVRFAQNNNQDDLYLVNSDGSKTYMYWRSDGYVGIGTGTPDAKLAVSGQVHAQEVKVSVTVPGPDYVFEKDYQLTSLEDIKTYIDQNKHLPEVPSAKEMEKNGVQLGEMNMLLLKKIEELTLYVIEQNRNIAEQNRKIEWQGQEINALKNKIK